MSVLEQQGADSLHQVKLQMYCRLCGEYKKGMSSNKFRFQADLQRYLMVDVCTDAPSIHPGKICTGCMAYLKRLKVYYRRTRSLKEPRKTAVFRPHSSPCRICDSKHSESPCKRSCPSEFPAPGPRTLPSGAQPDDGIKAKRIRRSSAENIQGDKWPSVSDSGHSYSRKLAPTPATSSDVEPSPSTSRGEPSTSSAEDKKDVLFFMLLNHLRETHDRRSSNLYNMWMAGDVDIEEEAPPVPRNQTCGICHEAGHNRKTCPNT
uniref:RAG1 importin-binding domain-containing protein n=1 Tax=Branchiostoma floridae TaxID=7739 RepID=C3ZTS9_BRAFL|eukprot:XP_002588066.1 hypothetical protein BRAFLDRAFT_83065 [Branchiostoma floridae]